MKIEKIFIFCWGLVVCDKWSNLKSAGKTTYLEKKARHRTLEEDKQENTKKKTGYEKIKEKKKLKPEKFLKDERWQLCQTMEDDDVKNTLLKFGLVTHLFDEVTKFRKTIKTLKDSVPTAKKTKNKRPSSQKQKLDKEKVGSRVKLSQTNYVGRTLGVPQSAFMSSTYFDGNNWSDLDDGNNYLGGRRRKRDSFLKTFGKNTRERKGTLRIPGQVPQCYGWKYLKALDALLEDNTVDTEVLSQSVSDMLDMNFSKSVSAIILQCGETLSDNSPINMCPPPNPAEKLKTCDNQCLVDTDCQYREMCCRAGCGGYRCLPVRPPKSHSCESADQFMQCLYQMLDNQLCSPGQH